MTDIGTNKQKYIFTKKTFFVNMSAKKKFFCALPYICKKLNNLIFPFFV